MRARAARKELLVTVSVAQAEREINTGLLYEAFLRERQEEEKFDPGEIRLSEAGLCQRRQCLRILGYEADEISLEQESIFAQGEEHEDRIYLLWAVQYPRRIRRQIKVPWWGGTGHLDIWVSPLKHIVESKSTKAASQKFLPNQHHVDQVMLYLHFWGLKHNATAELAYRIKETGIILPFPVIYDPDYANHLEERLKAIDRAVQADKPIPIPEGYSPIRFPCAWRTKEGVVQCAYWQHCWSPEVQEDMERKGTMLVVPELREDIEKYRRVAEEYREAEERVKKLRAIKKAIEDNFGGLLDNEGAKALTADEKVIVSRTIPSTWTDWNVKQALEDGAITPDMLKGYEVTKGGYPRWSIKLPKEQKPKKEAS